MKFSAKTHSVFHVVFAGLVAAAGCDVTSSGDDSANNSTVEAALADGKIIVGEDRPATQEELGEIFASQLFDTVLSPQAADADDDDQASCDDHTEAAASAPDADEVEANTPEAKLSEDLLATAETNAPLPINTIRNISFIYGPSICRAQLVATVFSTFGAAINVKLVSGPCTNSYITNWGDVYNTTWTVPYSRSVTGTGLGLWYSSRINPADNHQAAAQLCINNWVQPPKCSTPYVASVVHGTRGYLYIGKGYCKCKNGETIQVTGTAIGAYHCHTCCTTAKKNAVAQCSDECSTRGGVASTQQSTARCQVKQR
jgi:hypothetical protein